MYSTHTLICFAYADNLSFSSLQLHRKFSIKSALELFESDSVFKDNYIIIFCILYQAQFRIHILALINSEILIYIFIDKFFI